MSLLDSTRKVAAVACGSMSLGFVKISKPEVPIGSTHFELLLFLAIVMIPTVSLISNYFCVVIMIFTAFVSIHFLVVILIYHFIKF